MPPGADTGVHGAGWDTQEPAVHETEAGMDAVAVRGVWAALPQYDGGQKADGRAAQVMGAEQERGASGSEGVLESNQGGAGRILTGEHAARGGVGSDRGQRQRDAVETAVGASRYFVAELCRHSQTITAIRSIQIVWALKGGERKGNA
eukprot:3672598-Rhodomonas_salina.1